MTTITIEDQTFEIRPADKSELGLVFSTWMECARDLRNTRRSVFDRYYPDVVRTLIRLERIEVATIAGKDTVHAWACGTGPDVLHFAYVPWKLRGKGLGRSVVNEVLSGYPRPIWVSSSPLSIPNHPRYIYNPFVRQ